MRLKSFNAGTMSEAMRMVRQELGDEAIIVSTQKNAGGKGVRIVAAIESFEPDWAVEQALAGGSRPAVGEEVRKALAFHGTPARLTERLVSATAAADTSDPTMACAAALDSVFVFAPLPDHAAPRPFMLVGPPGCGKTIAVAKLAARSVLKRRRVGVYTADTVRAAAVEQLAAFTRILEVDLIKVKGPEGLSKALAEHTGRHDVAFIDTPGLNPFLPRDMQYLDNLAKAGDVEPILVLAAGGDPAESAEIGEAFGQVGATRLLSSRIDATRRLGAALAAADAAQLMFCDIGVGPHVANGLAQINPVSMARLLVPPAQNAQPEEKTTLHEPVMTEAVP